MTLAETDGGLSGTGSISGSGPPCTVSITGTRTGSRIDLGIGCPGFVGFAYEGRTRNPDTIAGRISGSGLPTMPLVLSKL